MLKDVADIYGIDAVRQRTEFTDAEIAKLTVDEFVRQYTGWQYGNEWMADEIIAVYQSAIAHEETP